MRILCHTKRYIFQFLPKITKVFCIALNPSWWDNFFFHKICVCARNFLHHLSIHVNNWANWKKHFKHIFRDLYVTWMLIINYTWCVDTFWMSFMGRFCSKFMKFSGWHKGSFTGIVLSNILHPNAWTSFENDLKGITQSNL